jgi:hypothetical protein
MFPVFEQYIFGSYRLVFGPAFLSHQSVHSVVFYIVRDVQFLFNEI